MHDCSTAQTTAQQHCRKLFYPSHVIIIIIIIIINIIILFVQ